MFISKNDRKKWPARREFDRSSPQSGRTLSVDRPLLGTHYGTLGRLDVYTGGLGPWRLEAAKIFNLRSDNKTEDGEVMCKTRLSFLSKKAQLLKKSFLFYAKNTKPEE